MTNVYIDVGAMRIQQYLSRNPTLRGHRAASYLLARATSAEEVGKHVGKLAEENTEAGDIDGIVSLVFPSEGDSDEVRVREIEDRVLRHLRAELPAAEFTSVWGRGDSYLAAYEEQLKPRRAAGHVRYDLPAPPETPLAAPCRICHLDAATTRISLPGTSESTTACPDCVRRDVPKATMDRDERTPEGQLRAFTGLTAPPDELSELVGLTGANENHLATVAVDGNAFGAFFSALAASPTTRADDKRNISGALAEATRDALAIAAYETALDAPEPLEAGPAQLSVVPHVVGGDDVLVTMPARLGWRFTLSYLEQFEEQCGNRLREHLDRLNEEQPDRPLPTPTASAGIVFAHHKYPLKLVIEAAYQRLGEAKAAFVGSRSSVQWQDITADGPGAPARQPVLLRDLRPASDSASPLAERLNALTRVPASHRARLAEVIRTKGPLTVAALESGRTGHRSSTQPFLPPLDRPEEATPSGMDLGSALSIARWWSCV